MSATKIGRNTTNTLKLLSFTINLHFVTSNQIFTDRKLNLSFTSSIYVSFLPLEMQKWLEQTKIYHAFSYFVWKETTHKPLQVPATKTLFSSVYVIRTTCFDECFLFYAIMRIPQRSLVFSQRNTKFYSCTQTTIRFFTAKYKISQFYPNGHSFFTAKYEI